MMEECTFIELGVVGDLFSWYRSTMGGSCICERLDRGLGDYS